MAAEVAFVDFDLAEQMSRIVTLLGDNLAQLVGVQRWATLLLYPLVMPPAAPSSRIKNALLSAFPQTTPMGSYASTNLWRVLVIATSMPPCRATR